jgi:AAHS family benzoate transporter-like MFS transporter
MSRVDVSEFLVRSRIGRIHVTAAVLCGVSLLADGYDVGVFGAIVPSLMKTWHISGTVAGLLGTAALGGMLLGAIGLGALADRIGRKPTLVAALTVFSVCTGLASLASGPVEFALLRFAAGLGLGGVLPLAATLSAEYAPARWRSSFVMWTSIGFAGGGLLAAVVSRAELAAWGWRGVIATGVFPLLLMPVFLLALPESLEFQLRRGRTERVRRVMAVMRSTVAVAADAELYVPPRVGRTSPARLFARPFAQRTVLLAIAFSCCLLMLYAILTWLPQLVAASGLSVTSGLTMLVLLNGGGVVGIALNGVLSERVGLFRVVVASYLCTAAAIFLLGSAHTDLLLGLTAFLGGMLAYGSSVAENAYAAFVYPAELRGSGTGWCLGIGRVGAMVGPYLGGVLLDAHLSLRTDYLVFAVPGLVATACVVWVHRRLPAGTPSDAGTVRAAMPAGR